jgi:hypothetical protein
MLVAPTRARCLSAVISAVSIGALAVACSSNSSNSSSSSGVSTGAPPCPASFADVASASCSVEGQVCPFLVPCVTFAANASCVCSGGHFVCAGFGDAGTACPVLSTTQACPINETAADGLFCSDLGLICTYPSACSGIPAYDSCQCVGGRTTDEGPHFECIQPCILTGDATPPAPEDGGASDAKAADDAPTSDGAADAGPVDAAPSTDGAGDP